MSSSTQWLPAQQETLSLPILCLYPQMMSQIIILSTGALLSHLSFQNLWNDWLSLNPAADLDPHQSAYQTAYPQLRMSSGQNTCQGAFYSSAFNTGLSKLAPNLMDHHSCTTGYLTFLLIPVTRF